MAHENSKENQTRETTAYRFGDFELHPSQRLLICKGAPVSIQPKSFDALLCLLSKAERLVSKKELTDTLWPGTFVSEANLTNIIGGLRKALGRDAIQTVSKYGYRFTLPVAGEPGTTPKLYEQFARAKELAQLRSLDSLEQARNFSGCASRKILTMLRCGLGSGAVAGCWLSSCHPTSAEPA